MTSICVGDRVTVNQHTDRTYYQGYLVDLLGTKAYTVDKVVPVPVTERKDVGSDCWIELRNLHKTGLLSGLYFRKVVNGKCNNQRKS